MVGATFLLSMLRDCIVQQMLPTYHYNGLSCLPYLYIGFSFGGLIAVAIAAKIWKLPDVSMQNLRRLKCITFSQPQIRMTLVEQVVDRFPEFVESVHALYLENDSLPRVMALLDRLYEQQSDPVPLPDLLRGEVSNQVYILCKCFCCSRLCTPYIRTIIQGLGCGPTVGATSWNFFETLQDW